MPRLIWVFTRCTCHFVGFVMRWLRFWYHGPIWLPIAPVFSYSWACFCMARYRSPIFWPFMCPSTPILVSTLAVSSFSTCTQKSYSVHNWAASSDFGTYRLCEQRRFRRACASAQSGQNLRCSLIQAMSQEEPSDRKPDPWPLWMAGHAWRGPFGIHIFIISTQYIKQILLTLTSSHRQATSPSAELFATFNSH